MYVEFSIDNHHVKHRSDAFFLDSNFYKSERNMESNECLVQKV